MNGIGNAKLVDSICSQLETAWQAGSRVTLEELISESANESTPDHATLVSLIQYEIELRRKHGESAQVSEYADRFPEIAPEILKDLLMIPALPAFEKNELLFPSRYQQMEMVGQGGIGQVWRVIDKHMDRTLAIKVSRQRSRDKRFVNLRLEREAKLTGGIQHPGIPPIFDHGKLTDGSEYFSMKLVEGKTLDKILQERNSDRSDLPALIGIFEQISQTVAYAHSQGVIHRDLKPQNVMVGKFGEVQVMDWGMGKRLSDNQTQSVGKAVPNAVKPDSNSETLMSSNDSSYADRRFADPLLSLTQTGEVFGTPAYMAPEQARGEIDLLGPQSDVFGLGAILFSILTDSRLYDDLAADEILVKAATGDLGSSINRLDSSESDVELIQLCKDCLEPGIKDRPADGAVVARRVTEYQDGVQRRLQQAELDQQKAEVRASEERKRRTTTIWLSGAILAAVTAGLLGALFLWNQSEKSKALAEANAVLADERFLTAKRTVDEYLTEVANSKVLLATPGTQQFRKSLLEKAKTYYTAFVSNRPDDPKMQEELAEAHFSLGHIALELDTGVSPIANFKQAINISQQLIDSGDGSSETHQRVCNSCKEIAHVLMTNGRNKESIQWSKRAVTAAEVWNNVDANNRWAALALADNHHELGLTMAVNSAGAEGEAHYLKALEIKGKLVSEYPDNTIFRKNYAKSLVGLAHLYIERQQREQARPLLDEAMEIQEEYETDVMSKNKTAVILASALPFGQEKESVIRDSIASLKKFCEKNPSMADAKEFLLETQVNLSKCLRMTGKPSDSWSVLKDTIREFEVEVEKRPDSNSLLMQYMQACFQTILIPDSESRRKDVILYGEKSISLCDRLIELIPENEAYFCEKQITTWRMLGIFNRKTGNFEDAENCYRSAIAVIERLESSGAANQNTRMSKAEMLNNLGFLYQFYARPELAIEPYEKAAELYATLAKNNPFLHGFRGSTIGNIGAALSQLGKYKDSIERLDESIEILRRAITDHADRTEFRAFLAESLVWRSAAMLELRKYKQVQSDLKDLEALGIPEVAPIARIRSDFVEALVNPEVSTLSETVAQAVEASKDQNSDCLVVAAEVAAWAVNEIANNSQLDHSEREAQESEYAATTADLLNLAIDKNSFLLFSPMTLGDRSGLKLVWERPELSEVDRRIEDLVNH